MSKPTDTYEGLKGRAYWVAQSASGRTNTDARQLGYNDVFDLIMADSDHPAQQGFLLLLLTGNDLSEAQRQVLLDGLAREYAGRTDWQDYVRHAAA